MSDQELLQNGYDSLQRRDYRRALQAFDALAIAHHSVAVVHLGRAIALLNMGEISRGTQALEQLLTIEPDHPEGKTIAQSLAEQGLMVYPANWPTACDAQKFMELATEHLRCGRVTPALICIDKAISYRVRIAGIRQLRATVLCALDRYREAVAEMQAELTLSPDADGRIQATTHHISCKALEQIAARGDVPALRLIESSDQSSHSHREGVV